VTIAVVTACDAVQEIMTAVKAAAIPRERKRPLLACLEAACESFDKHLDVNNSAAGVNQLEAFVQKVGVQIAPDYPSLANDLVAAAQAITEIVAER
jgi:hypothetical protein